MLSAKTNTLFNMLQNVYEFIPLVLFFLFLTQTRQKYTSEIFARNKSNTNTE